MISYCGCGTRAAGRWRGRERCRGAPAPGVAGGFRVGESVYVCAREGLEMHGEHEEAPRSVRSDAAHQQHATYEQHGGHRCYERAWRSAAGHHLLLFGALALLATARLLQRRRMIATAVRTTTVMALIAT